MNVKTLYRSYTLGLLLCMCAIFTGCAPEDLVVDTTPKSYIQVYLNVDGDTRFVSHDGGHDTSDDPYQHEGVDNLLNVSDLDFIFYTTEGQYITMASAAPNVNIVSGPVYDAASQMHKYVVRIATKKLPEGVCRVVVLANHRDTQTSPRLPFCMPYHTFDLPVKNPQGHSLTMTDEQYLYENLVLSYHNASDAEGVGINKYTEWSLHGVTEGRVPMWGVLQTNVVPSADPDPAPVGDIDLLRSIAKVKVSFSEELLQLVEVPAYQSGNPNTGVVMNYKRSAGMMVPPYTAGLAKSATTPDMGTKDKVAGVYSNANLNAYGAPAASYNRVPMYYEPDEKAYYMYLPEQQIGEANMNLNFRWRNPGLNGLTQSFTLHFADYAQAVADHPEWAEKALTEDQLTWYKFPVMRNHYYKFTVVKLGPIVLKYEVCDWVDKTADTIVFN